MLVSKQYGFGILAVVGHKILMEILEGEQKKIDAGANVLRVPIFGIFNVQVNVNAANPAQNQEDSKLQRIVDSAALLIQIGNSFINPGWTILSSLSHIMLKQFFDLSRTLKLSVKNENINPQIKQQLLSYILKAKYILIGLGIVVLLKNPFVQEVDSTYLKR